MKKWIFAFGLISTFQFSNLLADPSASMQLGILNKTAADYRITVFGSAYDQNQQSYSPFSNVILQDPSGLREVSILIDKSSPSYAAAASTLGRLEKVTIFSQVNGQHVCQPQHLDYAHQYQITIEKNASNRVICDFSPIA